MCDENGIGPPLIETTSGGEPPLAASGLARPTGFDPAISALTVPLSAS
jgi:hypothetical protein